MVIIAILALMMQEGYLVDICLIYAMISFLCGDRSYEGIYGSISGKEKRGGEKKWQ